MSYETTYALYWIPLLPLLGAAFNLVLGRKLSRGTVHVVACGTVGAACITSLWVTFYQLYPLWKAAHSAHADAIPRVTNVVFQWLTAGDVNINLGFLVDPLSAVMIITVTFVGFLIHVYSTGYMAHDRDYARFFGYLNLFTGAMLILVMGDSLVVLFVGWEGVGLCSYLLIGFWYNKDGVEKAGDANATAGRKAFIVNRIGDFAFVVGMFVLFYFTGTLKFTELADKTDALVQTWNPVGEGTFLNFVFPGIGSIVAGKGVGLVMLVLALLGALVAGAAKGMLRLAGVALLVGMWIWSILSGFGLQHDGAVTIAGTAAVLLLIGATGKSAQIPLYVWLPDAMAGPTPVSALIHAATMVTAGVYMVARLNFMYMLTPTAMGVVALVGVVTALFAATIGFAQNDIKKVLAYSTVSQLGFMFTAVGVGAFAAGIFHLFTHAFFKACLFLGAGSVIHAMSNIQDIRQMGGLAKKTPVTHWTFLASCLAIAGIVPFAGFFSKDEILWKAISQANPAWPGWFSAAIYVVALVAALGTAFYMFRLYYLTFSGESRADEETRHHIHESPWTMTGPLVVLALGAVVLGFLGLPGVLGEHANVFHNWLHPVVDRGAAVAAARGLSGVAESGLSHNHGAEWGLMALSLVVAICGILVARKLYKGGFSAAVTSLVGKLQGLHRLVFNKYWVDEIYDRIIILPAKWLARLLADAVDAFIIDFVIVNGSAKVMDWCGQAMRWIQSGNVQRYVVALLVGVGAVLFIVLGSEAGFKIKPGRQVKVGQEVVFEAHLKGSANRPVEYQWDFDGDGKWDTDWSDSPTVTHSYARKSTYKVKLRVNDKKWKHEPIVSDAKTVEVL